MERREKEAVRYLGFGKNTADERTLTMIRDCFAELEHTAGPRSICRIFEMGKTEDGKISIGKLEIESRSLSRNLQGCDRIVLFGATLGAETDRLLTRASLTDMAKAVVLQACADLQLCAEPVKMLVLPAAVAENLVQAPVSVWLWPGDVVFGGQFKLMPVLVFARHKAVVECIDILYGIHNDAGAANVLHPADSHIREALQLPGNGRHTFHAAGHKSGFPLPPDGLAQKHIDGSQWGKMETAPGRNDTHCLSNFFVRGTFAQHFSRAVNVFSADSWLHGVPFNVAALQALVLFPSVESQAVSRFQTRQTVEAELSACLSP